jgi:RNA methyltransferase, TrmH family
MPSPLFTTIRDLHRPRGRERRGQTLAEGIRLVEEALAAGGMIQAAVVSERLVDQERGRVLVDGLARAGVPTETVADQELEQLADTQHPQGVIAVVRTPAWSPADFDLAARPVVLALDAVQDPGNTGTILRTAQGLGAAGVISLPGTAELANPKVVRGSMGAFFRLPAVKLDHQAFLGWVRDHSVTVLAAQMEGQPITSLTLKRPVVVVVGNEGAGLTPEIAQAGIPVSIPLAPGTESLNVAVAAGILLYEVTRER